ADLGALDARAVVRGELEVLGLEDHGRQEAALELVRDGVLAPRRLRGRGGDAADLLRLALLGHVLRAAAQHGRRAVPVAVQDAAGADDALLRAVARGDEAPHVAQRA